MQSKIIWLSHVLDEKTPAYGDGKGLEVKIEKNMECGDSCNTVNLSFSNHLGTHVDAPYHFLQEAKRLEEYEPKDWVFTNPILIDLPLDSAEIIGIEYMNNISDLDKEADLILFRTGFERYRTERRYWESAPGFAPELATFLRENFRALKAIGMDTISLGSYQHRDVGVLAHQAFLGSDIRIFEDLSLANIPQGLNLEQVIALPLRFSKADGAPCTVIAWISA